MVHSRCLHRRLMCEALDKRQLMAVDVVETEPNNSEATANRFQWPDQAEVRLLGTSQSKEDKDYFVFTAASSARLNVNIASEGRAKLEVTTLSGSQVFENEPKHGLNSGSWQATAGETYLLRLRAPGNSPADYQVTLTSGSNGSSNGGGNSGGNSNVHHGAEVEPNNKPVQATEVVLSASAPVTLSGTASKRDRDFFQVQSDSAGVVTLDTGNSGVKVSVETQTGIKLFESEPQDGVTRGTFNLATGMAFLVRVRGTSSDVSEYSLALTLAASSTTQPSPSVPPSATVLDAWLDSSDDGVVSPVDVLLVINYINTHGAGQGADDALPGLDPNDDRVVTARDVLVIVNRINQHGSSDVNDAFDDSDIRKRKTT